MCVCVRVRACTCVCLKCPVAAMLPHLHHNAATDGHQLPLFERREVRLLRELRDQAQEEASRAKIALAELQVSLILLGARVLCQVHPWLRLMRKPHKASELPRPGSLPPPMQILAACMRPIDLMKEPNCCYVQTAVQCSSTRTLPCPAFPAQAVRLIHDRCLLLSCLCRTLMSASKYTPPRPPSRRTCTLSSSRPSSSSARLSFPT